MGGEEDATNAVLAVLLPFRQRPYVALSPLEKHLVQACIRALGRLREPAGYDALMAFFDTVDWARYAADALADFGDRRAVGRLIAAYPSFARELNNRQKLPERIPADDRFAGDSTQDRMPETPPPSMHT